MRPTELKIHYATELWGIACNNWLNFINTTLRVTDPDLVTCLTCKRTRLYRHSLAMRREQKVIVRNLAKCRQCGDVIESIYRHDFQWCSCGAIFVDGGHDYLRRGGKDMDNVIEMSETKDASA